MAAAAPGSPSTDVSSTAAALTPQLIPPVDAPITRRFDPPVSAYGRGHRGIDYGVPAGALVRSAGDGAVLFAGKVAGSLAVTVQHAGGLKTTYSVLGDVLVAAGSRVSAGTWLGHAGTAHPGAGDGLHFGVKLGDDYVDPELFLGPLSVADALHLAPLESRLARDDLARPCRRQPPLRGARRPPNDNVAVTIAGMGSKSAGIPLARLRAVPPEALGYRPRLVYRFSYSGTRGPRWHRPYRAAATLGDLRIAARRLEALLRRIKRRHPHVAVDLIAHSQGGIVARLYLEQRAAEWEPGLPPVEHLVTFATPHGGAPLAGAVNDLRDGTLTGGAVLDGASWLARRKGWWSDPQAPAVAQLAPGSSLLSGLASGDVLFGTRVLALGAATDVIVTADAARYPGKESRTLPPAGLAAHSGIRLDATALGLAYAWLRDAPLPCPDGWDRYGQRSAAVISWLERHVGWAYGAAEEASLKSKWVRGAGRVLKGAARLGARGAATAARGLRAFGGAAWRAARSAGAWTRAGASAVGRVAGGAFEAAAQGVGRLWP